MRSLSTGVPDPLAPAFVFPLPPQQEEDVHASTKVSQQGANDVAAGIGQDPASAVAGDVGHAASAVTGDIAGAASGAPGAAVGDATQEVTDASQQKTEEKKT